MISQHREAVAEAKRFVAACSGLSGNRQVRLVAESASEETTIPLGVIRALAYIAEVHIIADAAGASPARARHEENGGEEEPGIPEGYGFAARVTIGLDEAKHPLRADLLRCSGCSAVIFPGDRERHDADHATADAVRANLASLNEIMAEMTAVASDDPDFATLVRDLLRDHSHALGFEFQGDGGGEQHD